MTRTTRLCNTEHLQRRLLKSAQQGDRRALDALVRRYEPLVQRVVWNLRRPPGCDRDDVAQEARIGLLAAIRAWRPERGRFPAFAECCVKNRAVEAVHAAERPKHQLVSRAIPLETGDSAAPGTHCDEPTLTVLETRASGDTHADPEAQLLISEQLTGIIRALPTLTTSERHALAGTLNGETYACVAPLLGGTPKAACQAAYRARCKLADALARAA